MIYVGRLPVAIKVHGSDVDVGGLSGQGPYRVQYEVPVPVLSVGDRTSRSVWFERRSSHGP